MRFDKQEIGEGVYYVDAQVQTAALAWFEDFGFSLPKLDSFIDEAAAPADRDRLIIFRRRAVEMQLAGNRDAVEPWLLFFVEVTRSYARDAVLADRRALARAIGSGGGRTAHAEDDQMGDEVKLWCEARLAQYRGKGLNELARACVGARINAMPFATVRRQLTEHAKAWKKAGLWD